MGRMACRVPWWRGFVSDRVCLGNVQDDHKAPWRPWVSEVDSTAAGEYRRNVTVSCRNRQLPLSFLLGLMEERPLCLASVEVESSSASWGRTMR